MWRFREEQLPDEYYQDIGGYYVAAGFVASLLAWPVLLAWPLRALRVPSWIRVLAVLAFGGAAVWWLGYWYLGVGFIIAMFGMLAMCIVYLTVEDRR